MIKLMKKHRLFFYYLMGIGLLIVFDFLTKKAILTSFTMHEVQPVFPFFNLLLTINKGVGFSLFSTMPAGNIILFIVNLGISICLLVWLWKERMLRTRLALMFIIGGALGNLIDRMIYGGVIDFLDFHLKGHHWPAFNLADSFVCVGALLLVYQLFMESKNAKSKK